MSENTMTDQNTVAPGSAEPEKNTQPASGGPIVSRCYVVAFVIVTAYGRYTSCLR